MSSLAHEPHAWYGVLPERFAVSQVGQHFEIQLGKMLQSAPRSSRDRRVPYISVSSVQWGLLASGGVRHMYASPDEVARYAVRPGDLLVCEGGEGGRCAVVPPFEIDEPLITQNHVHRVRARRSETGDVKYLRYVLETAAASGWLEGINNGATIKSLSRQKLASLLMPLPPLDEQRNIVRYLDHAALHIGRAIQAKQELARLLDESAAALRWEVLTASSGEQTAVRAATPWMGALPEHWQTTRLKTLLREIDRRSDTGAETLLSLRMREGLVPSAEYSKRPQDPSKLVGYKLVNPGELVMNRMRASIGLFGIADQRGLVSPDYATFVVRGSVHLPYLLLLLKSPQMGAILRSESRGMGTGSSGFLRIYTDRFGALPVVLPGPVEQEERADEAEKRTARLNDALRATVAEIDLLKEYRTRLIGDVVTGRRDVRAEAASLPEVDPAELDAVLSAATADDEDGEGDVEELEHAG